MLVISVFLAGALTACGIQVPSDPQGTLDRVTGGVLHAGASISPDLVVDDGDSLSGSLVDLVEGFARSRDARVDWTVGSEETLVTMLESGALDIAVGGMTDATPWADRVGITRGYPDIPGSHGRPLVALVPLGENRMLTALERYLDEEAGP